MASNSLHHGVVTPSALGRTVHFRDRGNTTVALASHLPGSRRSEHPKRDGDRACPHSQDLCWAAFLWALIGPRAGVWSLLPFRSGGGRAADGIDPMGPSSGPRVSRAESSHLRVAEGPCWPRAGLGRGFSWLPEPPTGLMARAALSHALSRTGLSLHGAGLPSPSRAGVRRRWVLGAPDPRRPDLWREGGQIGPRGCGCEWRLALGTETVGGRGGPGGEEPWSEGVTGPV